jgi:hypothetical protein
MQPAGKIEYRSVISDGFDKRIEVKVGEQISLHKIGSAASFSLSSLSRALSSTTGSTWATTSSCWGASARDNVCATTTSCCCSRRWGETIFLVASRVVAELRR